MNSKWLRRLIADRVLKAQTKAMAHAAMARDSSEHLAYTAAQLALGLLYAELTKED